MKLRRWRVGMLLSSIARSVVERRRRRAATKRPVVADIGPDVAGDRSCPWPGSAPSCRRRAAARRPGHGARSAHAAAAAPARAGADLVGQRRHAQRSMPSRPIALALAVERLMLTELLEQHHGQQVRPGKATRRHMEGRRRLRDGLALAARRTSRAPSGSPSTGAGSPPASR